MRKNLSPFNNLAICLITSILFYECELGLNNKRKLEYEESNTSKKQREKERNNFILIKDEMIARAKAGNIDYDIECGFLVNTLESLKNGVLEVDINEKNSQDGLTALHYAPALIKSDDITAILIDNGAEVNIQGEDGNTPIHEAAFYGNQQTALVLINRGADVNSTDNCGITPLHEAAKKGNKEAAELLLDHGAKVNARAKDDATPLHLAAYYGNKEVTALLIAAGADIEAKDEDGNTPLHLANSLNDQGSHEDTIAILKSKGAK